MNIYFKRIQYKIHDYMFYTSHKNVSLSKSNIGIFPTFFLNFNSEQYVRKKLYINSNNLVRFCRNVALKLVQEH